MKSKFLKLYKLIMEDSPENLSEIEKIVEDIKNKLNSPEFFGPNERIKNKIIKYLNILKNNDEKNYENYESLSDLLINTVKLSPDQAKEMCNDMEEQFEPKTVKSLINYLSNRECLIDDWADGQIHSFTELFSEKGANLNQEQDKLIDYLKNKQFISLPTIGKTELLFSVIFKTAHRPGGKKKNESGDVIVNQQNLEVKGDRCSFRRPKRIWKRIFSCQIF